MPDREKVMRAMEYCTANVGYFDENDECLGDVCPFKRDGYESGDCQENMLRAALALLKEQEARWIPIVSRPMDEEERKEWSELLGYEMDKDEAVIYTSSLPDDGDEVITCDRYGNVTIDTFCEDEGCYFETPGDMDGIVAWMPKPHPYKPPKEEEDA